MTLLIKFILSLGISYFSFSVQAAESNQSISLPSSTMQTSAEIKPELKSCQRNKDCVAGLVGCWSWIPINKKFVAAEVGPFGGHLVKGAASSCRASKDPGPKPKVFCRNNSCEF